MNVALFGKTGAERRKKSSKLPGNMRDHATLEQLVVLSNLESLLGLCAPFMHDGCAATLTDRFNPSCGGGDLHGKTSQHNAEQLADLVSYLETL